MNSGINALKNNMKEEEIRNDRKHSELILNVS